MMFEGYLTDYVNLSLLIGACLGLAASLFAKRPRKWATFAVFSILAVFSLLFVGGPGTRVVDISSDGWRTIIYAKFFLTALFAGVSVTFLARHFLPRQVQRHQ